MILFGKIMYVLDFVTYIVSDELEPFMNIFFRLTSRLLRPKLKNFGHLLVKI